MQEPGNLSPVAAAAAQAAATAPPAKPTPQQIHQQGMMNALAEQRTAAENQVAQLVGQLSVLQAENDDLKETIADLEAKAAAPAVSPAIPAVVGDQT